ncbi:MAG: Polysaccharide deacetylase [uncultured Blastococcus sp.]|uniref:Polysaccharide deacetylase n=1 Tax=uncultured Blastococcus sp. TaxID=217144 RepID=A0A6J4IBY0_9ACTN|nr:MAG: Polysaccharide deacetylase [uncultured Blastococcus sp.]
MSVPDEAPSGGPSVRDWRRPATDDWRRGAAAALALTFDLDAESAVLGRMPAAVNDLSAMSHQAYGPQVGLPRILRLLEATATPATFFVPGDSARRWPDAVESILTAGHEIALHSDQHRSLLTMTQTEQEHDLGANLQALAALGVRPSGYRAPNWQLTAATLDLLVDAGLAYDSSLMDDDRPYVIDHPRGQIAELPVHWSLDDWEQYAFLPEPDIGQIIDPPSKVLEIWQGELDAMRSTGGLCVITCHPFLSGRPSRLRVLADLIQAANDYGDVEMVRCDAVAARLLDT